MVRKLGELPNFVVFNSRIESFGNSSIFAFTLLLFALYRFLNLLFECDKLGVSNVFMAMFSDEHERLPHVTITENWRLCSTGQHRPGFPRVLYDALLHLGYNGDVLVYRARMSMAHSMDQCEVSVTIPLNTVEPWIATAINIELDNTVEQTAQVTLTSLCGSHLADTATMPFALFPVHYPGDPVWRLCLEAISDPKGPHFHAGMAVMAEYVQYMFDLQDTNAKTVI
jgi:hypothetical protein